MCILRLSSRSVSFKPILDETKLPITSVYDAGEYRDTKRARLCQNNQATLDVSDKEWDDLQGQINDAICFLENHKGDIQKLFELVNDLSVGLDFPINSKLDGNIVTQGITFPGRLTSLAGSLNIDIGMTLYEYGLFE